MTKPEDCASKRPPKQASHTGSQKALETTPNGLIAQDGPGLMQQLCDEPTWRSFGAQRQTKGKADLEKTGHTRLLQPTGRRLLQGQHEWGWCPSMTSVHVAWGQARVRFSLAGVLSLLLSSCCGAELPAAAVRPPIIHLTPPCKVERALPPSARACARRGTHHRCRRLAAARHRRLPATLGALWAG